MAVTLFDLKWLSQIIRDLRIFVPTPIPLHCYSQAAIHIAINLVFHEQTKHLEIDCHFISDAFLSSVSEISSK